MFLGVNWQSHWWHIVVISPSRPALLQMSYFQSHNGGKHFLGRTQVMFTTSCIICMPVNCRLVIVILPKYLELWSTKKMEQQLNTQNFKRLNNSSVYIYENYLCLGKIKTLYQCLSKHQEVGVTPVTKVPKLIVVFWDLLGAIQKKILKDKFRTNHIKNWWAM